MRILSLGLIASSSIMLAACSSTPDRYAFWRDDAPADASENMSTKPNLGNIPTSPDVSQARQEMQDLQTKLAADRQAAYTQAQIDKGELTEASLSGITTSGIKPAVTSTSLLASNAQDSKDPLIAQTNLPPISHTGINNMATAGSTPSIINPNRTSDNNPLPVYTGPNVQVNRGVSPIPQQGTIQDYVYGRSSVQYRQRANEASNPTVDLNSDNITVDMSALGGTMGGNKPSRSPNRPPFGMLQEPMAAGFAASGSPTIYFKHGSAHLSSQDKRTLAQIVSAAQDGRTVKVIGHASKRAETQSVIAAKEANLKISATRASAVMKELAKHGVNPKQIKPVAVGDTDAKMAPSEKAARRVDIIVE
ncbi:MAG TPA: OmpA family protein [Alphaproteobacteria bacterium]